MELEYVKAAPQRLPLKTPHLYKTDGGFKALIEVNQEDTLDNSLEVTINRMWFTAQDLRSAATLFANLADHLDGGEW